MRSGLHGHPAKPIPSRRNENRASHSTREDADCVCIRVGEQVSRREIRREARVAFDQHLDQEQELERSPKPSGSSVSTEHQLTKS
jgi:hypothetical protein